MENERFIFTGTATDLPAVIALFESYGVVVEHHDVPRVNRGTLLDEIVVALVATGSVEAIKAALSAARARLRDSKLVRRPHDDEEQDD